MSNLFLPPEILDRIVALLHAEPGALRECSLVSKSWVPRIRKHLFADVRFHHSRDLESWEETFPDPTESPARYAETLFIGCPHAITTADAEAGGWIRGFSRVTRLEVDSQRMYICLNESTTSLVALHGFSPNVKSLALQFSDLPSSRIIDLVLSFPLLEDLAVGFHFDTSIGGGGDGIDELSSATYPPSLPVFTGSLELTYAGLSPIVLQLLSLPSGIHFQKLILTWFREEDALLATRLVESCAHTLDSLDVTCSMSIMRWNSAGCSLPILVTSGSTSVDLSKATRLREAVFRPTSLVVEWVAMTLKTITHNHRNLQQVSIHVPDEPYDPGLDSGEPAQVRFTVREDVCEQWLELDRLLARLLESHSIRLKIQHYTRPEEREEQSSWMDALLPEVTRRGIVDLVRRDSRFKK